MPRKTERVRPPGRTGRKPKAEFSDELVARVCERIAGGESLLSICKDPDMPTRRAWFFWLPKNPEMRDAYEAAMKARSELYAEEIVAIADEPPELAEIRNKQGEVVDFKVDGAFEMWRRTRIDSRKWIAARLMPVKYGDSLALKGDAEHPLVIVKDYTGRKPEWATDDRTDEDAGR